MSYKPRIAKETPLLVPEGRKQEKIAEFKDAINKFEGAGGIRYGFDRTENIGQYFQRDPIDIYHGRSFIKEIIPELKRKKGEGKVKILILGAGAALYADQVRGIFKGDLVVSTGLKKKNAKLVRRDLAKQFWHPLKNPKLNQNDLKQPSILFFHDFPEFDLIIDTIGEQFYSTNTVVEKDGDVEALERKMPETRAYLSAVIKKLTVGGKAFISPFPFFNSVEVQKMCEDICGEFSTTEVKIKITFPYNEKSEHQPLEIEKNKL